MTRLLLTVAGLTVAGLLSPGPNFVLITGRAMSSGTRAAVATAIGVSAGSLTHAVFGIIGVGALLRASSGLFAAAKLVGAAYLVWIGIRSLRSAIRSRPGAPAADQVLECTANRIRGTRRSALDGYLTQMSNPKSTLFFLALFSTVVPSDTGALAGAAVVATVVTVALAGYLIIALLFSRPVLQRTYRRVGYLFDGVFGVLMIALGVRVALTDR